MVKIKINVTALYPVFFSYEHGEEITVTEKQAKWIREAETKFYKVQAFLKKKIEESK